MPSLKFDGDTGRTYTEVGHSVEPGDIIEVSEEVAERLLTDARFVLIKVKAELKKQAPDAEKAPEPTPEAPEQDTKEGR